MTKKLFSSFLIVVLLVGGFAVSMPKAAAAQSTLIDVARMQVGVNASNASVISAAKNLARQFGVNVPEWGINNGTLNHRTLSKSFLERIVIIVLGPQARAEEVVDSGVSQTTGEGTQTSDTTPPVVSNNLQVDDVPVVSSLCSFEPSPLPPLPPYNPENPNTGVISSAVILAQQTGSSGDQNTINGGSYTNTDECFNYGNIASNNIRIDATVTDLSPTSFSATLISPDESNIPLTVSRLNSSQVAALAVALPNNGNGFSATYSFSLAPYLTKEGQYQVEEVATDSFGNTAQVTKVFDYNPAPRDTTRPVVSNNFQVDDVPVVSSLCSFEPSPLPPPRQEYNPENPNTGVISSAVILAQRTGSSGDQNTINGGSYTNTDECFNYGNIASNNIRIDATVADSSPTSFSATLISPDGSNIPLTTTWDDNIRAMPISRLNSSQVAALAVALPDNGNGFSATYSFSLAPYLTQEGQYRVEEVATDSSGNTAQVTKVFEVISRDNTPPQIFNNRYNSQQIINPNVTLSGNVIDSLPSSGLPDHINVALVNNSGSTRFTAPLDLSRLNEGTFSFNVNLEPGLNTIIEIICDNAGHCANLIKEITFYPARGHVSVQQVEAGNKRTDAPLLTRVFDNAPGSCAARLGNQPKNWEAIFNTCVAENEGLETNSPVVGNAPRNLISDLVGIGLGTGNKLVIVKSQTNTDGSAGYMGFKIPKVEAGNTYNIGFERNPGQDAKGVFVQSSYFTKNSNGKWQGSQRSEVINKGTLSAQVISATEDGALQVFTPEHITWTNGTEIYPFLFISDAEWSIDVCLAVPAGYTIVAPGTCDQAFIANEARVVEFKLSEGSSAATAILAQATNEPNVGVSLSAKAKGATVAKSSKLSVSGTSVASKRASDTSLAPVIAKIKTEQAVAEKTQAEKIATVVAEIEQSSKGRGVATIAKTFPSNLSVGARGDDVLKLQQYLNNKGFIVSVSGPGSHGQETDYFGPKTKAALKAFQESYQSQILAPLGLSSGTGYFGPSTRAFIKANP